MDKTRKKNIRRIIAWIALTALVALLTAMPLLAREKAEADGPVATIKSGTAREETITRTLSGGGILTQEDGETVAVPSGVKLTQFLVRNGDTVKKGDAVAAVDKITVMEAIAEVQQTLDYLSKQIKSADSDEGSTRIKSQTSGKVKILYAEAGDNVQDVILRHGALAVLSLDGRMAVELNSDVRLSAGDTVLVILAGGSEVSGRVESALAGNLTVSLADNGYAVGEEVTVKTEDGENLGTGPLSIHNPWNATAYYGTISTVHVKENQTVSTGTNLFTLKDVDHSTTQQLLVAQRQEYEEVMQELFSMYESGVLTAPCDGIVSGVDEESPLLLSDEGDSWLPQPLAVEETGWTVMLLSGEIPEQPSEPEPPTEPSEPETQPTEPEEELLTYTVRLGIVKTADNGNLTLLMANGTQTVTSLKDVMISTSQMTTPTAENIAGASVYQLTGDTLSPIDYTAVKAGDVLLFVTDSAGAYAVVRTSVPGGQTPGIGGMGGMGSLSGILGGMPGGYGGGQVQNTFQPYDLTESTVLTVTPGKIMTLDITIDELDIGRVIPGQPARVTVMALPGEQFSGTVTKIGTATNAGGSSKFAVTITLDRAARMLDGMSATATMELGNVETVLCIPAAALYEEGSRTFVYTGFDPKTETLTNPVTVTIGVSDGDLVQILSGLSLGDTFYYSYYDAPEAQ